MSAAVLRFDRLSPARTPATARTRTDPGARLCCARCGHAITDTREAMEMGGSHRHECTNPAGLRFLVGCFAGAPGCRASGVFTAEHTWFPGCVWRFAECSSCGDHLGWVYRHDAGMFFGLIVTRLMEQ